MVKCFRLTENRKNLINNLMSVLRTRIESIETNYKISGFYMENDEDTIKRLNLSYAILATILYRDMNCMLKNLGVDNEWKNETEIPYDIFITGIDSALEYIRELRELRECKICRGNRDKYIKMESLLVDLKTWKEKNK